MIAANGRLRRLEANCGAVPTSPACLIDPEFGAAFSAELRDLLSSYDEIALEEPCHLTVAQKRR